MTSAGKVVARQKVIISNRHEGIKTAAWEVLKAMGQRCRADFMRNALAFANKTQLRMVSAALGTVFVLEAPDAAKTQWRTVVAQCREKDPPSG